MKTSTMMFLGAAGAIAYYMYKNQGPMTGATTGSSTVSPPFAATSMLAAAAPVDPTDPTNPPPDDYSDVAVPSYSWSAPSFGMRAWRGGRGRRGGKR